MSIAGIEPLAFLREVNLLQTIFFIPWKLTDIQASRPVQQGPVSSLLYALLPSLAEFLHLGADFYIPQSGRIGLTQSI